MTDTRIADMIVPEVFNPYMTKETKERSQFFNSGIVTDMSDEVTFAEGGDKVNLPFMNDLSGNDEVLQEGTGLTLGSITSAKDIAIILERGRAWGVNDLAKNHSGADIVGHIAGRVGEYWARKFNAVLISTLKGAFAGTNMSGNVLDISAVGSGLWTAEAFIDATQLLGDAKADLQAVAFHSAVESYLKKLDLIDYVKDSQSGVPIPFYQGKRVVIDDQLTATSTVYPAYLFAAGCVGFAEDTSVVMSETDRVGRDGIDELITRRRYVMHPRGVAFQSDTITGLTPSNANLELAANWAQAYPEDKQIPMVQFKFKIA